MSDERVHPSRDDPVVRSLSDGLGGPLGEHAGRHPWWTPVRVLLALTALCCALGMVQKASCYAEDWRDGEQRYTHMCYSDLPYLYTGRGLVELSWPYSEDPEVRQRYPQVMEYPVLISYWAWGTAWAAVQWNGDPAFDDRGRVPADSLTGSDSVRQEVRLFVVINAIGFALLALLSVWLLARVDPRRPWDAAAFALAPPLALSLLINWDMVAVVFVAGALYAWARERPLLAGLLIGLGTAAKLYPLFLLGGILVLCLRRSGRIQDFLLAVTGATGAWVLANLPAYLTGPGPWRVFWEFNADRGADLGSVWLVIEGVLGSTFTPDRINAVSWIFFGAWCVAVLALGLAAPRTPTLAQLGLLVVVGFLLVNKVYSPQYVLWLLPLAALAVPRWRDQIVWQGSEVLYFAAVWWYLGGHLDSPGDGVPGFYWLAIAVRMAGELTLVAVVVRDLWRREPERPQTISTRSNAVAV